MPRKVVAHSTNTYPMLIYEYELKTPKAISILNTLFS